jgi:hypothetical protein
MATVTVRVAAAKGRATKSRQATIKLGAELLTLPITSPEVTHSRLSPDWVEIDRPDQKPLQRKGSPRLRQMQFTVIFTKGGQPVEAGLQLLRRFSNAEGPLTVAYGPLEAGLWRLTDVALRSVRRQPGTDAITQAEAQLTFTEHSDDGYVKPASARPTPKPTAGTAPKVAAKSTTRTYVVVGGDTLSKIAVKFYGSVDQMGKIASANKIRNPDRIYAGQRLTIP